MKSRTGKMQSGTEIRENGGKRSGKNGGETPAPEQRISPLGTIILAITPPTGNFSTPFPWWWHRFDRHTGFGIQGAGGLRVVGSSNVWSPLAGTSALAHHHRVVNITIMGDSRPVSGCCRIDVRVIRTSAYV